MADIVLTTLNAKYIHTAFGLRYLFANLGPLQSRAAIMEFDISHRPADVAEALRHAVSAAADLPEAASLILSQVA